MALVRRLAGMASLAAALTGCSTTDGSKLARDENRKMDTLSRCAEELEQEAKRPTLVARSQERRKCFPRFAWAPQRP